MGCGKAYTAQKVWLEVELASRWSDSLNDLEDLDSLSTDIRTGMVTTKNDDIMSRHDYRICMGYMPLKFLGQWC